MQSETRPWWKPYNDNRDHFIERLKERYNIIISNNEYDQLCSPTNIERMNPAIKKSSRKTFSIIEIKGIKIPVLYSGDSKSLSTVYPANTLTDIDALYKAIFGMGKWKIAKMLYNKIVEICNKEYKEDFENASYASNYFYHECTFFDLLIQKYKHGSWDEIKLAYTITGILNESHPLYKFEIELKRK